MTVRRCVEGEEVGEGENSLLLPDLERPNNPG